MSSDRDQTGDFEARSALEPADDHVKRRFRTQATTGTKPEMYLRSELHARGLRYRVNCRPEPSLRRTADLVFKGPRVAVFVDGCFWHGCPDHFVEPKRNRDWWVQKIESNRSRDQDTTQRLQDDGWIVVRLWEHEIRANPSAAADRVAAAVHGRYRGET